MFIFLALHTLHIIFSDMFLHIIEVAVSLDNIYGIRNSQVFKFRWVVVFSNTFFNFFLWYVDFVDADWKFLFLFFKSLVISFNSLKLNESDLF